jgi:hypothetical protein
MEQDRAVSAARYQSSAGRGSILQRLEGLETRVADLEALAHVEAPEIVNIIEPRLSEAAALEPRGRRCLGRTRSSRRPRG